MRKILLCLLVLILSFSMLAYFAFAGAKKEAPPEEEAPPEKEAPPPEEKKLIFWDFQVIASSYMEQKKDKGEWYITKALKRFEKKYPGLTIELAYFNGMKAEEMLTAAAMSGSGPDVVICWGWAWLNELKDSLIPLGDHFTAEEIAKIRGWEKHEFPDTDTYYVVPITSAMTALFYNKDLFRQAGVDPELYDGTIPGLIRICRRLKAAGITPLVAGAADGWGMTWLEGSVVYSEIPDVLPYFREMWDGKEDYSKSPALINGFQAVRDLVADGYFNDDLLTIQQMEGYSLFTAGKGAMFPGWAPDFLGIEESIGDALGIYPFPSLMEDSPNFGAVNGDYGMNAIVAFNYSKHPDIAVDLIKFLRSPEEVRRFIPATSWLPGVEGDFSDVITHPIHRWQYDHMRTHDVPAMMDHIIPGPVVNAYFSLETQYLSGKMSVEEFLMEWDKARDEFLAAQ